MLSILLARLSFFFFFFTLPYPAFPPAIYRVILVRAHIIFFGVDSLCCCISGLWLFDFILLCKFCGSVVFFFNYFQFSIKFKVKSIGFHWVCNDDCIDWFELSSPSWNAAREKFITYFYMLIWDTFSWRRKFMFMAKG